MALAMALTMTRRGTKALAKASKGFATLHFPWHEGTREGGEGAEGAGDGAGNGTGDGAQGDEDAGEDEQGVRDD